MENARFTFDANEATTVITIEVFCDLFLKPFIDPAFSKANKLWLALLPGDHIQGHDINYIIKSLLSSRDSIAIWAWNVEDLVVK